MCYVSPPGHEAGADGADPVRGDPVPEEEAVHRHRWVSEGGPNSPSPLRGDGSQSDR